MLSGLLDKRNVDFLCFFSSIAALLGDFGSCDYAVANRFELAFAKYAGRNAMAICWPLWSDGGMGLGDDVGTRMYLQLTGQRALSGHEGIELCERLLAAHGEGGASHALVLLPQTDPTVPTDETCASSTSTARTADVSAAAGTEATLDLRVKNDVATLAGDLLKLPLDRLDADESFANLGFDSIGLVTFANRLSKHFGLELLPSIFFSHPSVTTLSNALVSQHRQAVESACRRSSPQSAEAVTSIPVAPPPDEAARSVEHEPIAIVGMSGRFPGARNVAEFWDLLVEGKCAVDEIPQTGSTGAVAITLANRCRQAR